MKQEQLYWKIREAVHDIEPIHFHEGVDIFGIEIVKMIGWREPIFSIDQIERLSFSLQLTEIIWNHGHNKAVLAKYGLDLTDHAAGIDDVLKDVLQNADLKPG